MNIKVRRFVGALSRVFCLGWGWCYCCNRTWNICESHSTKMNMGEGCFPLCEDCWKELTPETRLPYYRMLFDAWVSNGDRYDNGREWNETWKIIVSAVEGGG